MKVEYKIFLRSHMCLRYEKIICYDWIIQRLLEVFVYTDFIFIVTLLGSIGTLSWNGPNLIQIQIIHHLLEEEE